MRTAFFIIAAVFFLCFFTGGTFGKDEDPNIHNVLYINSYSITYSWSDSIAKGIGNTLGNRDDIILYIEHLDSKRFGNKNIKSLYKLFKIKYQNTPFDIAIVNDNNALDFLIEYGDSLIPDIPVTFCGVNNPEDYDLRNSRFYGIKEGVDKDLVNQLILRIMPGIKKLYFIADSTTTSIVNINYIKKLEPRYDNRVKFEYIINIGIDSLMKVVRHFEKGNAIALIDIFQDIDRKPVKPDVIAEKIAGISPVPIFIDHQAVFGKGICGGIINDGVAHGKEVANLALQFLDDPDFIPEKRIALPKDNYYFDYKVLKKFNIDTKNLPAGSRIINEPHPEMVRYLKYIILLAILVILLVLLISLLVVNIDRRKKVEMDIQHKIREIQDKNIKLEESNRLVFEMNTELENINEYLSNVNIQLSEAKKKSEESDRLKSVFLSNMSHEIRTPLNAIVGFSNLLINPDVLEKEHNRYVEIINSNSEQLLKLIDDILELSKAEAENIPVSYKHFSFPEIVDELISSVQQNIKNTNIEIRISKVSQQSPLIIQSDPHRFKQIFGNLLSNAIKFTEKGYIELGHSFETPEEITFYVKDTGIGINKKDLKNIFDRFWKVEKKCKHLNPGTGLGLAISKKLCEMLGGKMWVKSVPEKGTIFYFTIPYARNDNYDISYVHKNPNISGKDNWKGITIVVAEDENDNLLLLCEILKKNKANVISFQNGVEIVDFFTSEKHPKVDLILMDIKMPKMDGNEAARRIKELYPDIPVIAQTAYAMEVDIKGIRTSRFDDIIIKPIKMDILAEKINKILGIAH